MDPATGNTDKQELSIKDQVLNILQNGGEIWDQPVGDSTVVLDGNGVISRIPEVKYGWQIRQVIRELSEEGLIKQTEKSENGGHMILRTSFGNPAYKYEACNADA